MYKKLIIVAFVFSSIFGYAFFAFPVFANTWTTSFSDVTASRSLGTDYQNTTTIPICLSIVVTDSVSNTNILSISSTTPSNSYVPQFAVIKPANSISGRLQITGCVPPNYYYSLSTSNSLISWYEYSFDVTSSGSGTSTTTNIYNLLPVGTTTPSQIDNANLDYALGVAFFFFLTAFVLFTFKRKES